MLLVNNYTVYVLYMLFILSLHTAVTVPFPPHQFITDTLVYLAFSCSAIAHPYVYIQLFVLLSFRDCLLISPFLSFLSYTITLYRALISFVLIVQSLFISAILSCCVL